MAITYTYIGPDAHSDAYLFTQHAPEGDVLIDLTAQEVQGLGLTDLIRAGATNLVRSEYVQQGEAQGWRWFVVEGSLVIDNRPAIEASKARVEDGEPFTPIEFQHVVLPMAVWDEIAVAPQ